MSPDRVRRYTTGRLEADLRAIMRRLIDDYDPADADRALAKLRALRSVRDNLDKMIDDRIVWARRRHGAPPASWAAIGDALDITGQAAGKRARVRAPSATREHLVLMRGQLDTERDGNLLDNRKADAQGRHRYTRAGHAHAVALARDPQTNWRLVDVPGADHAQQLMAAAAQRFLLDADRALPRTCPVPDGDPCP